jgi:hypothetical protein
VIKVLRIEPEIGTKDFNVGSTHHSDTVNLVEVDGQTNNGVVALFYISLNIHDLILHNTMLDSSAYQNLMTKVVMEKLGLEVTRPYKYLPFFLILESQMYRPD